MRKDTRNICRIARRHAGMTQERWAEACDISPDAVAQYEIGRYAPSDDVVLRMAEVSGLQIICYWHLLNKSACARSMFEDVHELPLSSAVIRLLGAMQIYEDNHDSQQILRIARDGLVDGDELPDWNDILQDLQDITQAALELKYCKMEEEEDDWCF